MFEIIERGWGFNFFFGGGVGKLVEEGCEEVRVVDLDGKFLKDIFEREFGFL